jgi:hypothetical protein
MDDVDEWELAGGELPLEELLGLVGPLAHLLDNLLWTSMFIAISVGIFAAAPYQIGRSALWVATLTTHGGRGGGGSFVDPAFAYRPPFNSTRFNGSFNGSLNCSGPNGTVCTDDLSTSTSWFGSESLTAVAGSIATNSFNATDGKATFLSALMLHFPTVQFYLDAWFDRSFAAAAVVLANESGSAADSRTAAGGSGRGDDTNTYGQANGTRRNGSHSSNGSNSNESHTAVHVSLPKGVAPLKNRSMLAAAAAAAAAAVRTSNGTGSAVAAATWVTEVSHSVPMTMVVGYTLLALLAMGYLAVKGSACGPDAAMPLRLLTFTSVFVKVVALLVCEVALCPVLAGWWLDICSFDLQHTTFTERRAFHQSAPWTSTFLHWLVGMLFMHAFASFVALLREMLRPGVLWFFRDPNEPAFHPLKMMLELPVSVYVRRLLLITLM